MSPTTRNLTRFIPGKEKRPESLIPDETYIVKVKGFPWWPVMILDNAQVTQNTKDSLKNQKRNIEGYYFHYFHTFEYGYEDINQFRVFNSEKWKFQLEQNLIERIDHRAAIRQALYPEQFLSDRRANIEREFAYEAGKMGKEEYESNEVELTQKEELREEYEKKTLAAPKDVHKREIILESRPESEGTNKKQRQLKNSRKKRIHPKLQSPKLQMEQTATEASMSILSDASQVQEQEQQQSKVETEEANQQRDEQQVQPDLVSASGDTNGENPKEKSLEINETRPLQEQEQQQRLNVETEQTNQQLDEQVQPDVVSVSSDTNGENEEEKSLEINDTQPPQEQQQHLEAKTEKTNQQRDEQVQPDLISVSGDTNEENENEKLLEINETQPLQEQPQNERQNHVQKSENIPTQQQKTDGRCCSTSGIKREIDEQNDTQKPQAKRKRHHTNDSEPLMEIQDTQQQQEIQSLPNVAIVPGSPEYESALTTCTMDCQLPEISLSVGESNIMQFDDIQINNDTVEPIEPITAIHENSTDPKLEINSTTPMKTDDDEEEVELAKNNDDNDTNNNSSIHEVTQDPNFKRAITIKYRLQTILSKHENTKEWPTSDNRLMKVAIQDIQKSQLSKSVVQTLHLGYWVSKASKYTFTMDKDKFDYKTELDNILLHWDVQSNK